MRSASFNSTRSESASVLIIVLWVAFGLVALALYFANSMSMELRAADNRVAATEAEQAIMGAVRYVSNILANAETKGTLPDLATYKYEAVPLGNATFWLIGRSDQQQTIGTTDVPTFGLTDENSKLNLNANNLSVNMFQQLPGMTAELAAAIKDWRDADDDVRENGAESDVYQRRNPPYRCKNADFESVDELRLVYGAELTILYGEDVNLNGILDPNENDGDISPPSDNRDGHLDRGILDFLTVFSWQPNIGTNIQNTNQIRALLQQNFGATKANQILSRPGVANSASVLEFYVRSGLTADEFQKIEQSIIVTNSPYVTNLVNVNTASEPVLTCIPGIGTDKASSLIAQRRQLTTLASLCRSL